MQYFQGRGTKENVGVGLRRLSPPQEFAPMRPTVEMPAVVLERYTSACKNRGPHTHETLEMKAVVVPPEALPSQQEPLDILDEWIIPNDE